MLEAAGDRDAWALIALHLPSAAIKHTIDTAGKILRTFTIVALCGL